MRERNQDFILSMIGNKWMVLSSRMIARFRFKKKKPLAAI